jgi:hypothetical protein
VYLSPIFFLTLGLVIIPVIRGQFNSNLWKLQPGRSVICLPDTGFSWSDGEEAGDRCDTTLPEKWVRKSSGSQDLFVSADGPAGSGRFWTVTVGIGDKQHALPVRGVCLKTSTIGWRTLQNYSKGALSWLEDMDGDGRAEFILWDSFPLSDPIMSMAEYGLVAWVFRPASTDSLVIDPDLSRIMAESLAKEYRMPLDGASDTLLKLRFRAAEILDKFGNTPPH